MTPSNGGPETGAPAPRGRFGRFSALSDASTATGVADPAREPTRADGPERSPDFLGGPAARGRGVRRLNRVPLLVALSVLVMVFGALMYTVYQRAAARRQQAATDAPAEQPQAAAPPMFADAPAAGVIPPDGAAGPSDAPVSVPFDPNYGVAGAAPASGVGADGFGPAGTAPGAIGGANAQELDAARLQAWQMYRQEVATLRQQRFQHAVDALGAASRVDARGSGGADAVAMGDPAGEASVQALAALAQQAEARGDAGAGAEMANALAAAADAGGLGPQGAPPAVGGGRTAAWAPGAVGRAAPRNDPTSPHALTQGMVIPAMLVAGVNSDLPGQVLAQVSEPVYDGATGEQVLIPQGAKLVGTYSSTLAMGQQRVLVAWRRVIYPDGSTLDLAGPGGPGAMPGGGMPGADQGGAAGFKDRVDNHYRQTFGHALLLSLFSAGVQLSQPQRGGGVFAAPTPGEIAAGAMGQQLGQLGMETARRGLNLQPRLEIRPGYRFNVMVTQDVPVRAWTGTGAGSGAAGGRP